MFHAIYFSPHSGSLGGEEVKKQTQKPCVRLKNATQRKYLEYCRMR